jgi:hypothetical protein
LIINAPVKTPPPILAGARLIFENCLIDNGGNMELVVVNSYMVNNLSVFYLGVDRI